MTDRPCTKCGVVKSLFEYSKDKQFADGHARKCKICKKEERADLELRRKESFLSVEVDSKKCYRCHEVKPRDDFGLSRRSVDGLTGYCRSCVAEYSKAHRVTKPALSPDELREYRAQLRERQLEKKRQDSRLYYASNKDKTAARTARRRARLLNAPSDQGLTKTALREIHGDLCYFCGVEMDFGCYRPQDGFPPDQATHEHLLPLTRGGANTFENSVLACRRCNNIKHNKTEEEFLLYLERVS